ncbi:MAG: hypothetical protein IT281_03540 [Ignavibacteria bacterium]|nr:hypothetical protein [Ignavibacteria bacterium]
MKSIKILFLIFITGFFGCEMPADLNPPGDNLKGYLVHIDSNLYLNGGFYSVSIYNADSSNPFNRVPVRTDSLNLTHHQNFYQTFYEMNCVPAGRFYLASTWSSFPRIEGEVPIVLGTYGCDTSTSCTDHEIILYPNFQGNFRNFTSNTDLSKRLF